MAESVSTLHLFLHLYHGRNFPLSLYSACFSGNARHHYRPGRSTEQPARRSHHQPTNGAVFSTSAPITIEASATDSDGTVVKVEFIDQGTGQLLGVVTNSPYRITITNSVPGNYTAIAKATDNLGAAATSAPVSITVTAPVNVPPTVAITNPTDGSTATAPFTGTILVDASDRDGTITKVEFFANGTLVGTDTQAPYSLTVSNLSAGVYNLTAKATDNQGATTTSIQVKFTINEPQAPIVLSSPARSAGQFRFSITGLAAGKTHVIQSSTNLPNWISLSTNIAPGGAFTFTDPSSAGLSQRWYRVLLPIP